MYSCNLASTRARQCTVITTTAACESARGLLARKKNRTSLSRDSPQRCCRMTVNTRHPRTPVSRIYSGDPILLYKERHAATRINGPSEFSQNIEAPDPLQNCLPCEIGTALVRPRTQNHDEAATPPRNGATSNT